MRMDDHEVEVWCSECNAYLHSVSRAEVPTLPADEHVLLVRCQYRRGPGGSCTAGERRQGVP